MFSLRAFLILVILLTLTQAGHAWFFTSSSCSGKKSCKSCTSIKSWLGASCRWCPKDGKCHARMAFLTNPCSKTTNIINEAKCSGASNIIHATYNRNIAYKMVFLSALAYADNVANYIAKTTEVDTFRFRKQVTKQCQGSANCSGFVAVSHSEKSIVVSFRGSQHTLQVIYQAFSVLSTPKVPFVSGGKVQDYFDTVFQLIWKDLKPEVYQQITNYPSYKIWVTGHSLGGALASMASTMIAYEKPSTINRLVLYTFGQPRTGDYKYAKAHDRLVSVSFRITHYRDPAVRVPKCKKHYLGNACLTDGSGPYHHGTEIYYGQRSMTKYSPYKVCTGVPKNEDNNCSNGMAWLPCLSIMYQDCIQDHYYYFGIKVGDWWLSV